MPRGRDFRVRCVLAGGVTIIATPRPRSGGGLTATAVCSLSCRAAFCLHQRQVHTLELISIAAAERELLAQ